VSRERVCGVAVHNPTLLLSLRGKALCKEGVAGNGTYCTGVSVPQWIPLLNPPGGPNLNFAMLLPVSALKIQHARHSEHEPSPHRRSPFGAGCHVRSPARAAFSVKRHGDDLQRW
jgi:hypothetical protein